MSEYQLYEFQALDRPLTPLEQKAISLLSSRVKPTSRRAVFTYGHGDFRGDSEEILAQYFDALYYIANWGTQQLMFRFPDTLIRAKDIEPYCVDGCITLTKNKNYYIMNLKFSSEEGFGWIEEDGKELDRLSGLRDEILQRDYRLLYLGWLKAIFCEDSEIEAEDLEPPIPAGLQDLTPSQKHFIELFGIDEALVSVAAQASPERSPTSLNQLQQAIAQLSRQECDRILAKLMTEEPTLVAYEVRKTLEELMEEIAQSVQGKGKERRTVQHLHTLAECYRQEENRKSKEVAKLKHLEKLKSLAPKEPQLWETVNTLLAKPQTQKYDEAVKILIDLRDLAMYQDRMTLFQQRINDIYQQYQRRSGLLSRLQQAGLQSESSAKQ